MAETLLNLKEYQSMAPEAGAGADVIVAAWYRHLYQVISVQRLEEPGLLESNP